MSAYSYELGGDQILQPCVHTRLPPFATSHRRVPRERFRPMVYWSQPLFSEAGVQT